MKKAENTGNYIDISFSNKRNNVFLLLLYKSYYLNLVTFAVAPPVGAWIEITKDKNETSKSIVAPPVSPSENLILYHKNTPFLPMCH